MIFAHREREARL
jgi:uncharacterized protein